MRRYRRTTNPLMFIALLLGVSIVNALVHTPIPPPQRLLLTRLSASTSPDKNINRRSLLAAAAVSATALTTTTTPASAAITKDSEWPLWPALPVAPYSKRKTIRYSVGPNVWAFDQLIGIYYVHLPIRMTVIATKEKGGGGLLCYAPVAPTRECLSLLQELIEEHGPVKYIILPSVAVEHKVLAGPFARRFPSADFYAVDKQYSFPVPLPSSFLGLPRWTKPVPASSSTDNVLGSEFEYELLDVDPGPASAYQDVALYHKPSKTLLVCDALLSVGRNPPRILIEEEEYTKALLFHARDNPLELPADTPENRLKGWRRIVLLFNFFVPGAIGTSADIGIRPLLKLRPYAYGWGGWLPFRWTSERDEIASFDRIADGKPTLYTIVQIILSRGNSGETTLRWVDKVKQWDFERVIPAHLDAPLEIGPREFSEAYDFIRKGRNDLRVCDEDVRFLRNAEESFLSFSVFPSKLGVLRGVEDCGLNAGR